MQVDKMSDTQEVDGETGNNQYSGAGSFWLEGGWVAVVAVTLGLKIKGYVACMSQFFHEKSPY